ncbi:MAG: TolC family protein [Bacteroidales bacterium]|nr:TolC family protein [Bacteroidales bacterium]
MKKIIVSLIWLVGVIPGLTGNLTAAQPLSANKPWTLEECINYALAHNLSVQQSALQVQQREIDLNTAQNSRLPGVAASASQNFSFGRGLTADNTYANTNTTSTGFSLGTDMTLFNGFRTRNTIELNRLNLKAATQDLEKARDDIRVAVAQAYVQILYNQEILDVALRQIEIDSLQVARLETMRDNGKAAAADVALQQATLAQSRLTAVQAANNLQLAELEMAQLLELPSPEGFKVALPAYRDPVLPVASPDEIYEEALGIKPAILAEETRLAYAERNIDLAKGGYLPSLSLNGGLGTNYYTSSGYPNATFFTQLSNNFSQYLGLSLSVPIFSRMNNRNQVRSARVSYEAQQLQLDQAKKTLFKEIQQAWYNAVAARTKYESSVQAEEAAAQSLSLVQAKYENGKASITEFNESKNQYLKAASDLAQARCEALYQAGLLAFYRGKDIQL